MPFWPEERPKQPQRECYRGVFQPLNWPMPFALALAIVGLMLYAWKLAFLKSSHICICDHI